MPECPGTRRDVVSRAGSRVVVALLVLVAMPPPAQAEWHLSPFFGFSFKADTTLVDPEDGASIHHWTYGGTVALLGRGLFGVEGQFQMIPGFFENDEPPALDLNGVSGTAASLPPVTTSRVTTLMGNAVLAAPLGWNEYGLRPFVSGGLGLIRASQRSGGVLDYDVNMLGWNVGGGAEGPLSDHTGLRFDLRFFRNLVTPEQEGVSIGSPSLRFWTASVGFVFRY